MSGLDRASSDTVPDRLPLRVYVETLAGVRILAALALLVLYVTSAGAGQRTAFGTQLGGDFGAYYIAGRLAAEAPDRLYDLQEQRERTAELLGDTEGRWALLYPYAPYLAALVCRPISALPYAAAYAMWSAAGITLFTLGVVLLWRAAGLGADRRALITALLLALSFQPFLHALFGGQASLLAFGAAALAVTALAGGRPGCAGFALSVCLFKPTLLPLLSVALVVTGGLSAGAGLVLGCGVWTGLGALLLGPERVTEHLRVMSRLAQRKTDLPHLFQSGDYMDAANALRLLWPGAPNHLVLGGIAAAALLLAAWSTRTARRAPAKWGNHQRAIWAQAFLWTPVLSPHFGLWDGVLLVAAGILAHGVHTNAGRRTRSLDLALLAAVYGAALAAERSVAWLGVQPMPMVVAVWGLRELRRQTQAVSTPSSPNATNDAELT